MPLADRSRRKKFLDRLALAAIKLYDPYPLYWGILSRLAKVEDPRIATMAVGFTDTDPTMKLFYNVDYGDRISDEKLLFCIIHELCHVGLVHPERAIGLKRLVANIACDLLVNESNAHEYVKLVDEEKDLFLLKHNPYLFEGQKDGSVLRLPNPKVGQPMFPCLDGMDIREATMEEIYIKLMQNLDQLRSLLRKDQPGSDGQPGDGEPMEGDGLDDGNVDGYQAGSHSPWRKLLASGELTDEQKAAARKLVQDSIKSLGDRSPGNVPGELQRLIDEIRKTRHDWRRELTLFAQTVLKDEREQSWRRYNRRLGAAAPGHAKQYRAKLLVVIDNSGSIDKDTYMLFMGHVVVLSELLESVKVIGCDTRVNFEREIKEGKIPDDLDLSSGGGTAFQPPFDYAEENEYDGVVYLTDGYGPAPSNTYGIPAIFAICPHGQDVPGFKNLHIED